MTSTPGWTKKKYPRIALVAIALGFVGVGIANFLPGNSVSATISDPVEAAVAQFENARLAVFSPLAVTADQSTFCTSSDCNGSASPALNTALAQMSNVQLASPSSVNWTSPSLVASRFNVAQLAARNQTLVSSMGTTEQAQGLYAIAEKFVSSEQAILAGNDGSCGVATSCSITSAAGAKMLSFSNEKVTGSTATIDAIVQGWQQQANVSHSGDIGPWEIAENELQMSYTLSENSDGVWSVSTAVGDFVPGQAP